MRITPTEICSGVSQITYIHIRDEIRAQLQRKYMLGGVGVFDSTASTLLVNMIICRTQSNSKRCAYAFTYDGAELILACTTSMMPRLELSLGFVSFFGAFAYLGF
jgi:hypothetical protein